MQELFDKIIIVYTDDDIRLKRLMCRNNFTKEDAKARMNSQIPQEKKLAMCDFVINNNGNLDELRQNTLRVFGQIQ